MGGAIAELALQDTLASSAVTHVSVLPLGPVHARTAEGVGPGSTLADLARAYGEPRITVDQCRLYATFARTGGLMFELPLRNGLTCSDVERLAESRDRVPRETRVGSVVLRRLP